jgi:type IV secretory pathway VirB4 component
MGLFKKKPPTQEQIAAEEAKSFFDCICPSTVKFFPHHYIVGDSYRCVWAIKEYPPSTEEQAILSHLADHSGVTLRIYNRVVDHREHDQIINHANRKNRLKLGDSNITEAVQAEQNLLDVTALLNELKRDNEPLLHCAVFLELKAKSLEELHSLKNDLRMETTQAKLSVDMLTLRQKEGFLSVMPFGRNQFGTQFERVLPASSVSNMYPFNFSGKTDPQGFYIGRDRFGTNIIVDLDRRADDKTTGSALILGNSGMGKSYLLKLLITNLRESGKSIIGLDAEGEMQTLAQNNGGCYLDFLDGRYMINLLEPKAWASEPVEDPDAPEAFRRSGRISQHIAFLKDWFRSYKDFSDMEVDTIEIMLSRLYENFHLTESTDFSKLKPTDYPIMEDLFELCMEEYRNFDPSGKPLYTEDILQRICLGLNSVCVGAESRFFNGHTNIEDNKFLIFGVKGIMDLNKKLRCAIEFNILSYMTHQLLSVGNTVATLDELYLFLDSPTTIEYIRNAMKRVRKMDSALVLASQNIEDFLIPSIREFTKPLFSIPTHQFLFNPGMVNDREYIDALQVGQAEYDLIRTSMRGICLYRCGNERYLLQVLAPDHKKVLFGTEGGR